MYRFQKWAEQKAVFFNNHYTVAHCSDPNYLSILSGLHPFNHGIQGQIVQKHEAESWPAYPAFASIAVWLKKFWGHKCGGYTATYPKFYYYGFDEVTPMGRNVKTQPGWIQARAFIDGAKQEGNPWYFFVRTMDCHEPYKNRTYKKAVKFTDNIVADLIGYVERNHPDTLIVFTSDHGEMLGEHGVKQHFYTLYQPLLRVPMYLSWPGCPGGTVVEEFTQHIDIFPTVIDLFVGDITKSEPLKKVLAGMDGYPMTWAITGYPLHDQMTFLAKGVGEEAYNFHWALIDWPWKYIGSAHARKGPKFELFNLEDDPGEESNLAKEMPGRLQKMAEGFATSHYKAAGFVRPDTAGDWHVRYEEIFGMTKAETEKMIEHLRGLGYA